MRMTFLFTMLALLSTAAHALPTLYLTNQFGEQSQNYVTGGNYIGGSIAANTIPSNLTSSAALPVANTYAAVSAKLTPAMLLTGYVSGAGVVASTDTVLQGINKLNGNAAAISVVANAALPSASFTDAAVTAKLLTGFVAGAGAVSASDTVLQGFNKVVGNQALGLTPGTPQALSATGAVSVLVMETTVTNASTTYAVTLAAPSGIDGQIKIIKAITAMTGTVTMALTNVSMGGSWTPSGTTTLTFTSVGDSAVFIAIGAKWVYLGGSAVAS